MPTYEVVYYAKFCCLKQVDAPNKAAAKEKLHKYEEAKGGLHQFTVHEIKQVTPEPKECTHCHKGLIPVGEYDVVVCEACKGSRFNYEHIIK